MSRQEERRLREAAEMQRFARQYARKAQKGQEPNDRRYDRDIEQRARQMRPEDLDALLRDGEDGVKAFRPGASPC